MFEAARDLQFNEEETRVPPSRSRSSLPSPRASAPRPRQVSSRTSKDSHGKRLAGLNNPMMASSGWTAAMEIAARMRANTANDAVWDDDRMKFSDSDIDSDDDDDDDYGSDVGEQEDERMEKTTPAVTGWLQQSKSLRQEEEDDDVWFSLLIGENDLAIMETEAQKSVIMHDWARFDLFFGTLCLIHGVTAGLVSEGTIAGTQWVYLETALLCAFLVELSIRFIYAESKRAFFRDMWIIFDIIVIVLSISDLWVVPLFSNQVAQTSSTPMIRIVRMFRLVRLVRLSIMMRELWLLVSGMVESLPILFWMLVLLSMLVYVFALFAHEFYGKWIQNDIDLKQKWGTIARCMLSLMQIATYDNWADMVRDMIKRYPTFLFLVVPFITLCSLGILNLIVGVMLTTALQVSMRDSRYKENLNRMRRHVALLELRREVLIRCANEHNLPLKRLSSDKVFLKRQDVRKMRREKAQSMSIQGGTSNVLMGKAFKSNRSHIAELMRIAGISGADVDSVFDEIDAANSNLHTGITLCDFIKGCMWLKGKVHALDVLHVMAGLKSVNERFAYMTANMDEALGRLKSMSEDLLPILKKWNVPPSLKTSQHQSMDDMMAPPQTAPVENPWKLAEPHEKLRLPDDMERAQHEGQAWAWFDGVFSSWAMLNAVVLGVSVSLPPADPTKKDYFPSYIGIKPNWQDFILFIIENVFLMVYSVELYLRVCLYYQIKKEWSYEFKMLIIPKACYSMTWEKLGKIVRCIPEVFADYFVLMDFAILVLAIIDTWIIQMIFGNGHAKGITVLRIFRLLRVLRLLRLFYLIKDLWHLVSGMARSLPLLFWAILLLLMVVYMASIVVMALIKGTALEQDPYKQYWGSLPDAMLTMGGIASFDNWVVRVLEVDKYIPGMKYAMTFFVVVSGFGILNLVIGMMVQAAFSVVQVEKESSRKKVLIETKDALQTAKNKMLKALWAKRQSLQQRKLALERQYQEQSGTSKENEQDQNQEQDPDQEPAHEVDEENNAISEKKHKFGSDATSYRKKDGLGDDLHDDNDVDDQAYMNMKGLTLMLEDEDLIMTLQRAQIRVDQVLMVFQKLDVAQSGKVKISEFIEGLLRMKQRVEGIDVATAKSWARRIVLESQALERDAKQCHLCFRRILEVLRGVKFRDKGDHIEKVNLHNSSTDVRACRVYDNEQEAAAVPTADHVRKLYRINANLKRRKDVLKAHLELRKQELCTLGHAMSKAQQTKVKPGTGNQDDRVQHGDAVFQPAEIGED